jgi:hypothetical protein
VAATEEADDREAAVEAARATALGADDLTIIVDELRMSGFAQGSAWWNGERSAGEEEKRRPQKPMSIVCRLRY